ncbi:hypothetical protein [Bradyrhizobium sp. JR3.5]
MFSAISEAQYDEVSECLDIARLAQYFQVWESCLCSITIVVVSATGNLGNRERISLASPAPSMVPGITISLKTRSILAGLKQFQCGFG